jgi:hypothetical protein
MSLNLLARCEFCQTRVRDWMQYCPTCHLHLSEPQRDLLRANVLLEESGRWIGSGEIPPETVDRLMSRYRERHLQALHSLSARSPRFLPAAVPVATLAGETPAPAVAPPPPPPPLPAPIAPPAHVAAVPPPIEVMVLVPGASEPAPPKPARMLWHDRSCAGAPAKEERMVGVFSETQLTWIANAGIVAVFVAVILLVLNHWGSFAPGAKVMALAAGAGAAMAGGAVLRRTFLATTGASLFVLGALSVPVVFMGAAWFRAIDGASPNAVMAFGLGFSAAFYYALALFGGLTWFRWLGAACVLLGHGFGLAALHLPAEWFPAAYAALGVAFAGVSVAREGRTEALTAGACALIGALCFGLPAALAREAAPVAALHVIAAGGFALFAVRRPSAAHGVWLSALLGVLLVPFAAGSPWLVRAALPAAVGAAALFGARNGSWREALFTGGIAHVLLAGAMVPAGYALTTDIQADRALLAVSFLLIPAFSWTALRRDEDAWAVVALALPGAAFFALKRLLHLPDGWLPVGLGAYAAALYAVAGRANVHSRAAAPVGIGAHLLALAVCCNPGGASVPSVLPVYWNDLGWRAALALALPGASLLAFRVRGNAAWMALAEASVIAAALFAGRACGLPAPWAPAVAAGIALGFVVACGGSLRSHACGVGAFAAMAAVVCGALEWRDQAGPASFVAAAAVLGAASARLRDPRVLAPAVFAASLAWICATDRQLDGTRHLAVSLGLMIPAAAAALSLRDLSWRRAVALPAAAVCAVLVLLLAAEPGTRLPVNAFPAAGGLAAAAMGALALGLRRNNDEAAWSLCGALGLSMAGAFAAPRIAGSPEWAPALAAAVPAAFVGLASWARALPQGRPWAAAGGIGLVLSLLFGLGCGPLAFGAAALIAASGAVAGIRLAPAGMAFAATFLVNAALASFLVHAGTPASTAAPALLVLAVMEAAAASLAGARATGSAVFAASGALAAGALVWACAGSRFGPDPELGPVLLCVGIAGVAAVAVGAIRRQPYLYAIALIAAAGEYFLALQQARVTVLEAYLLPPAGAVLAAGYLLERRKIVIVTDAAGGTKLEASLSQAARSVAAQALEGVGTLRMLAVIFGLGPIALASLPMGESAHTPWALAGGAAVLVLGVAARRKAEALAGSGVVCGLAVVKLVQWLVEQRIGVAWWILIVGASLIGVVAVFEAWRSLVLKGKSETVKRLVEGYLARWR